MHARAGSDLRQRVAREQARGEVCVPREHGVQPRHGRDLPASPQFLLQGMRQGWDNQLPATATGKVVVATQLTVLPPPALTNLCMLLFTLQRATCADVRPVSSPGAKFECPVHTEFVPEAAPAFPPTQSACCKVRCSRLTPHVLSPTCKALNGNPLSARVWLLLCTAQVATCQDVQPISSPGKKYKCPAGMQYNPQASAKMGPTTSICCVVRAPAPV